MRGVALNGNGAICSVRGISPCPTTCKERSTGKVVSKSPRLI